MALLAFDSLYPQTLLAVSVLESLLLVVLRITTDSNRWRRVVSYRVSLACLLVALGTLFQQPADPIILVPATGLYSVLWLWRLTTVVAARWPWLSRGLRDSRYAALWLERWQPATLALSTGAIAAMQPSLATIALLVVALRGERQSFSFWRPSDTRRYEINVIGAVMLALLAGLAIAIVSGRVSWMTDEAFDIVVAQLIAVQLVLGIIPTTAAAIAVQVAAGRVSLSVVRTLRLDRYVSVPLALVVASIALDFVLLPRRNPAEVELAALVALVAVLNCLWYAREFLFGLDTGRLGALAIGQLSRGWWDAMVNAFDRYGRSKLLVGDPFATVERLLALAVEERDGRGLDELVGRLVERVDRLAGTRMWLTPDLEREGIRAEEEIALDDYLFRRLRALIQRASADSQEWVLDSLLDLRRGFAPGQTRWQTTPSGRSGAPTFAPAILRRGGLSTTPTGTRVASEIARSALRAGLYQSAREAIRLLGHYLERTMDALPPSDQVPSFNPQAPRGRERDEHYDLEAGIDELLALFENLANEAVAHGLPTMTTDIAWDLAFRLDHIRYAVKDPVWARSLGRDLFWAWRHVVELAARNGVCALRVNAEFWDLEKGDSVANEVAGWMAACARQGLSIVGGKIDLQAASQCSRLTRHVLSAMPDVAGALTKGLEDVAGAVRTKAHAGDPDANLILHELEANIARIWDEAKPVSDEFQRGFRGEGQTSRPLGGEVY